jgi:uncharacterized protein (TIGR03083 family)
VSAPPTARELLGWAVAVARRSVADAVGADPRSPTPCREWDLAVLVRHLADSARAVRGLLGGLPVAAMPPPGCDAALRELAELAATVARSDLDRPGDDLIALAGAYELTVHAWDVAAATGRAAHLSAELVAALLLYAPHVLSGVTRTGLFADVVRPSDTITDLDRLLALFGRRRRPIDSRAAANEDHS